MDESNSSDPEASLNDSLLGSESQHHDAMPSLTHVAYDRAFTVCLSATGRTPFVLVHMHSDTFLHKMQDVRDARRHQRAEMSQSSWKETAPQTL